MPLTIPKESGARSKDRKIPDVDAWFVPLGEGAAVERREIAWLDAYERNRSANFCHDDDRRLYEAAHVLLRRLLGETLSEHPAEIRLRHTEGGKPVAVDERGRSLPISFSLSHTRGFVAIAISRDCEVGIDVENVASTSDLDLLADFALHPAESAELAQADPGDRLALFFRFWTAKEAFLKCIGTGLIMPLHRLRFSFSPDGTVTLHQLYEAWDPPCSPSLHGGLLDLPEAGVPAQYAFSVACAAPVAVLNMHEFGRYGRH